MALGCSSFMTAGRVLVNHIPPSPRRFTGIKFFASGLAWGIVAGPLLAAAALSLQGWRMAFFALLLPAAVLAALSAWLLDDPRQIRGTASSVAPGRHAGIDTPAAFCCCMRCSAPSYDFFVASGWLFGAVAGGAACTVALRPSRRHGPCHAGHAMAQQPAFRPARRKPVALESGRRPDAGATDASLLNHSRASGRATPGAGSTGPAADAGGHVHAALDHFHVVMLVAAGCPAVAMVERLLRPSWNSLAHPDSKMR